MMQLVVPTSQEGGVYDFARRLEQAIGRDQVCLIHLAQHKAADWRVEPGDTVVLQFSGYGFAKRGAPLWLLHEIERRRKNIFTLGVFFHELYAFGPPWSSSFWLSPVQRHIARRLAELSDFWVTSREGSAQWLRRYADYKPNAVLPVFSNIGELASHLIQSQRKQQVVVFGSPGLRRAAYEAAGRELFDWARSASLEIHDIGSAILDDAAMRTLRANGVLLHGHLGEVEISRLMSEAQYGLLAYPADYVAKSGVFAAYCAHAICPVLLSGQYRQTDGIEAGEHYIPGISKQFQSVESLQIGQAAWAWYQPHGLERHVQVLGDLMRECGAA